MAAWDQMLVVASRRFKTPSNMSYDCFAALSGFIKIIILDFMMLWHCDSKYDHQIKEINIGHRFIFRANSAWKDQIPVNRKCD